MANSWGIPKEVEEAVLQRDKACVYCGVSFSHASRATKPSWEHIINDVSIATIDNIALCCVGCNSSKGAKLLHTWIGSPLATKRGVSINSLAPVVLQALQLSSVKD